MFGALKDTAPAYAPPRRSVFAFLAMRPGEFCGSGLQRSDCFAGAGYIPS